MEIRVATIDDAEEIYDIERFTFSTPWHIDSFEADLKDPLRRLYYVMEDDDYEIVAYAGSWIVADEGHITNVAVLEKFRGNGYGEEMVSTLIKELFSRGMVAVFLEVRISNRAAISMYEKLGFSIIGERKDYYHKPTENAYIMSITREEYEK